MSKVKAVRVSPVKALYGLPHNNTPGKLLGWFNPETGAIFTANFNPSDPLHSDAQGRFRASQAHKDRIRAARRLTTPNAT